MVLNGISMGHQARKVETAALRVEAHPTTGEHQIVSEDPALAGEALYLTADEAEARHVVTFLRRVASLGASPALRDWVREHWRVGERIEESSMDLFSGAGS